MAWGLPDNQKIHRLFAKRERGLRHAITNEFDRRKLVRAAESVREAKLKILKFNFSKSTRSVYEASAEALEWKEKPVDDIIGLYDDHEGEQPES